MTATIAPNSQAISEWVKIFPKQVIENFTSSVTFMKQLTVVAISTITYLKSVFPDDSYIIESFGDLKLRILKKKCRDEFAQFLSTAMTQSFEAFDKRYLHQLALCFYDGECKIENLIEYHIFEYSYHCDGATMNVHSRNRDKVKHTAKYTFDDVRDMTRSMMRACVVLMETCQNQLPSTYDVSLRLYYNDDAPADYQAPGFTCTVEEEDHLEGTVAETVRLGWVETPFHKLIARSYIKDTAKASREVIPSHNEQVITQEDADDTTDLADNGDGLLEQLRCPCDMYAAETNQAALLTCQYCRTRQHAACFGVQRAHAVLITRHCCADCHDADPSRRPTDAKLAPLSARKRECLCIFRRTLEWCTEVSEVGAQTLAAKFGMSILNAAKLIKLLDSHRVIQLGKENNIDMPQKIHRDHLKNTIDKFFQSTGEESIVDRLLAETFASQDSHSDPVSEILSPLEKIGLQNASSVCRIVSPAGASGGDVVEDSTLKQYREAILSNDTSEEPADVTDVVGNTAQRKIIKRKIEQGRNEYKLRTRSGARTATKRAKYESE